MSSLTPMVLDLRMPFYPIKSTYDKRTLVEMQDPAMVQAYVQALRREAEAAAADYADCEILAVHIGGGIAGHADDEGLGQLLRDMRRWFHFADDAQVSLKVHPGMVSVETLNACQRGRVNRLSVDYVTSDPFESEAIGRFLPPNVMETTMMVLGNSPLALSFDLITGLPGQSEASLMRTLDQVKAYGAKEIVLHPLQIIPETAFADRCREYASSTSPRRHMPNEKESDALWHAAQAWCAQEGYLPGSPGRFALPGWESTYHRLMAEGIASLGFGLGAVTRTDGAEAVNISDLSSYIRYAPDPTKIIATVRPLAM